MEEIVKSYKLNEDGSRTEVGTYIRNSDWPENEKDLYIVGINNWIINSNGDFLVQQRSLKKKNNPGKWSSTNGLVQLEEDGIDTVLRETKEELGLEIKKDQVKLFKENHVVGNHLVVDIYVTKIDVDLERIVIQEDEVEQICFVSLDELLKLDISTTCSYIKEYGQQMLDIIK